MAFLADLVASYLLEKSKTLLNWTNYHGIYRDDRLVVSKGNNILQAITYLLVEFQKTVYRAAGNQHPQLIS